MDKKRILIALSVFVLGGSAFVTHRTASRQNVRGASQFNVSTERKQTGVPDYVVYDFVFKKVVLLTKKTRELRTQGVIGQDSYLPLQSEAALSDEQAQALQIIAYDCRERVEQQDEKAKPIIAAFQAHFPGGRVPKGGPPPRPPELEALWEERNAIILQARDQLHAALGDEAFTRFDNYAKFNFGTNSAPVSINAVKSASQ